VETPVRQLAGKLVGDAFDLQEAQLMLTNVRDAFRGLSRSPNIVPSHMLDKVSSCVYSTSDNVVTLKSVSEVTLGH